METIAQLPDGTPIIGAKAIIKKINSGKVKEVVVANNCPASLIKKVSGATVKEFDGNEKELGTKLGKPFPIAMAGFE
jgi:ribosomal protein L30E